MVDRTQDKKARLDHWDSLSPSQRRAKQAVSEWLADGGWIKEPAKFAIEWAFIEDHPEVLEEWERQREKK